MALRWPAAKRETRTNERRVARIGDVDAVAPTQFDPQLFLARVEAGKTRTELRRRQIVFSQGDPADAVFSIRKGRIELKVLSRQGKEAILAALGAGDFFGEGCLTGQPLRMATAAAATECTVMRIEKSAMAAVLRDEPVFSALFVAHPLTRNIRLEEDLVDQLFNSSEKRLARVLLLLADLGKDGKPEAVIAKISQESLAERIGTTRSRVSFFMNKFRKLGFVAYNCGALSVHSSLLNVLLHD
jgi:CRP/FNR family transcriptional regulator, cyclic AMP receptor protein